MISLKIHFVNPFSPIYRKICCFFATKSFLPCKIRDFCAKTQVLCYTEVKITSPEISMRRKDREITDEKKIREIINACDCCRIGFCDGGDVYIVPLSFGHTEQDGRYTFYFHGAKAGRKFDLLQASPRVGFEMDTGYAIVPGKDAASCSARFQSIIGNGVTEIVTDEAERIAGLCALMRHSTGKAVTEFPKAALAETCVFKLTVDSLSCKEHE